MTLIANISGTCGSITATLPIAVGTPQPSPINWFWNAPPNRVLLDVDDVPGATSYKWYLDGVLKATTSSSSYQLPMNGNVSCDNSYIFGVIAVGPCGESNESYVVAQMPPCDFGFMVSPNPATDNLAITADESKQLAQGKTGQIRAIEIRGKTGIVWKQQQFGSAVKSASISVATLPNDVYTLRIYDGESWQSCKILVQH